MCPYTLDHNKMLASTMQHSTHNHTPTTGHHHEHHTQSALDNPTRDGAEKTLHRCLLRTQQRAKPPTTEAAGTSEPAAICVPPSHTHTHHANTQQMLDQVRNQ